MQSVGEAKPKKRTRKEIIDRLGLPNIERTREKVEEYLATGADSEVDDAEADGPQVFCHVILLTNGKL